MFGPVVDDQPPLILIDGHNLLWRAAHGFPKRILDRWGADVTGVFGFFALARAAARQIMEAEWIVCFDGEFGAAERASQMSAYKAQRSLDAINPILSLGHVQAGLDVLAIPWIEVESSEADDVIGTIIGKLRGREVMILSSDKDFYQVITPSTRLLDTARRAGPQIIGVDEVLARFGVMPRQWCDFRALTGDPSDNIAGVPGIGQNTAARLLAGGAILEDLEGLGRLEGSVGDRLRRHWVTVLRDRELIRFRTLPSLPQIPAGALSTAWAPAKSVLQAIGLW